MCVLFSTFLKFKAGASGKNADPGGREQWVKVDAKRDAALGVGVGVGGQTQHTGASDC